MHSSRRRSKMTGNCVSAGYSWSIYIGLWSAVLNFGSHAELLVYSLFVTAMSKCVILIEFKHYITYIRSCFIHVSTCSQQPLHSIIITLLTRHIQWSFFVLLTDYTRNCNMFIIFHAWYQNTFVLYIPHAWRGIFSSERLYFLWSCEVSFCSSCDRRRQLFWARDDHLYIMSLIEQYVCSYACSW